MPVRRRLRRWLPARRRNARRQLRSRNEPAALVDAYCVGCHNARVRTAGLALDETSRQTVAANPQIWEKVVRKLRAGAMPPAGRPRPDAAKVAGVVSYLETALDRRRAQPESRPARSPSPESHRIQQRDSRPAGDRYRRPSLLPADNSEQGFDNIADALSVSPACSSDICPPRGRSPNRHRTSDDAGFGDLPARRILISGRPHQRGSPFRFARRRGRSVPISGRRRVQRPDPAAKKSRTTSGDSATARPRHPSGWRRIKRFKIGGRAQGPPPVGMPARSSGTPLGRIRAGADKDLEVRFPANAGPHVVGVTFVKETPGSGRRPPAARRQQLLSERAHRRRRRVGNMMIGGPYDANGIGDTAEPPQDLRVPSAAARGGGRVRQEDSLDAGAPRLSPSGRRHGS